ncbi:MAG: hypothetical protein ACP5E9_08885 [Candidatus Methanospirareceae archaeon]
MIAEAYANLRRSSGFMPVKAVRAVSTAFVNATCSCFIRSFAARDRVLRRIGGSSDGEVEAARKGSSDAAAKEA